MSTRRVPITVLIPCYNSADVIGLCLESVAWADEIFVVDSFSTDETLEIARRYTDRIVQHEYVNSATQKNWAIPQATHEWVLIVDTDERVPDVLRREIERVLVPDCPYDGFRIPRLNHVFGHPIRHGGHYPDYQLRLFRRDRARYQDRQVHAHVDLEGRCGTLSSPLLHFGQRSIDQIARTYLLRYSAWEAIQKDRDGVRFRPHHLVVRPIGAFVVRYVKERGFLDGTAGLFMAMLVATYVFLTYARLWQLQARSPAATPSDPAQSHSQAQRGDTPAQPGHAAPIRVGCLVPHTRVGGAEVNLRSWLAHVDRSRVEPLVLAPGDGALAELLRDTGVRIVPVPTPRFFSTSTRLGTLFGGRAFFNPFAVAADVVLLGYTALRYARALRRERVQVVHTGSIFAHLLGALAAPLAGARLLWHVQDIVSPRLGGGLVLPFFARLGARRAALIACPSDAVAANLRAHGPANLDTKLRVIPNGIDLAPYDPALASSVRDELGIPDDAFVALHAGRLVHWKGQREFLQAAALVARERPDARFLVVGDVAFEGPAFRHELHRLAAQLGLSDRVVFTGWRRDMPAVLAASDVLVHSSILPEPFGLVLVEAMAMEKPVVASCLGGSAEIVRDGQDGCLVDPRDPSAIAAALLYLAADPDLRARLGRSGRARALALYTADRFASDMADAIETCAEVRSHV